MTKKKKHQAGRDHNNCTLWFTYHHHSILLPLHPPFILLHHPPHEKMVVKLTFLPSPSLSPSASPATDPPLIISQTASSHPTLHFPPATTQKFALRFNITFKTQTRAADVYLRNETPQKINVPWGFTALLKCAKMVDPGLEWDVSQGWVEENEMHRV